MLQRHSKNEAFLYTLWKTFLSEVLFSCVRTANETVTPEEFIAVSNFVTVFVNYARRKNKCNSNMKDNAQKIDAIMVVIQIITKVVVIDCEKIVRSSSMMNAIVI